MTTVIRNAAWIAAWDGAALLAHANAQIKDVRAPPYSVSLL